MIASKISRRIFLFFLVTSVILSVLNLSSVDAAMISGDVYDENLDLVTKAIVTVNSTPLQRVLSKEGYYEFQVGSGTYEIKAEYVDEDFDAYATSEVVEIGRDSVIKRDLFLFAEYGDDFENLEENMTVNDDYFNQAVTLNKTFLVIALWIMVMVFIIKWFIQFFRTEKVDDELQEYLEFIKKNKRMTQKDIRKEFPLSEAKISLIISDLESKGLVKKIKKGRSNIIIYQKKKKE